MVESIIDQSDYKNEKDQSYWREEPVFNEVIRAKDLREIVMKDLDLHREKQLETFLCCLITCFDV